MRVEINGKQAILHSKTTPAVLNVARTMEGRRGYLKTGGMTFEATAYNLEIVRDRFPEAEFIYPVDHSAEFEAPFIERKYVSKSKPYKHQEEGEAKIGNKLHFAFFMEQGTGKTKLAIDWAARLFCRGLITGVLVASKKGPHEQWVEAQLPMHCGMPFQGAYIRQKGFTGSLLPDSETIKFFSMNHDSLKTDRGYSAAKRFIEMHKGKVAFILDESQVAKNPSSDMTKVLMSLSQMFKASVLLTGTPIATSLIDEWSQLRIINPAILGMKYVTSFRNEYCRMGGYQGREVIGYRNIERFRERVDPHTFRVRKVDIGMAAPVYDPWVFQLTDLQKKMIKETRDEETATLVSGQVIDVGMQAVAAMRRQQISNGFIMEGPDSVHRLFSDNRDNPRVRALLEKIESVDGKVVIWARFKEDIKIITEALEDEFGKSSIAHYHGATSDADRRSNKAAFMSAGGPRFFLSTPPVGGTGTDGLQTVCCQDIFYSNSDNYIDRVQAEARIDRIGSTGIAYHTDLICRGAEDFKIRGRHKKKTRISAMAVDDYLAHLNDEDDMDDITFEAPDSTYAGEDAFWNDLLGGKTNDQSSISPAGDWE